MTKIICLAAAVSLVATAAFAQADSPRKSFDVGSGRGLSRTDIVFLPGAGEAPEIEAITKAVRNELERSRQLEPRYVDDDSKAKLAVPVGLAKDASGEKLIVAFQLTTARRLTERQEVTCAVNKPANCARDIVTRAEKFIRDNRDR